MSVAADSARALRALADRVERLKPLASDPEAFFVERDEIRAELGRLAKRLLAGRVDPPRAPLERFSAGTIAAANGRRIACEVRGARRRSQKPEARNQKPEWPF